MAAFAALGALLKLVKRHALSAKGLHHQDRIGLDNALTAATDDCEVIASPRTLIDRIQLMSSHASSWNIARTVINT